MAQTLPADPRIPIFCLTISETADLAGPSTLRGSVTSGLVWSASRKAAIMANRMSVSMFTLFMPFSTAFLTASSGTPEVPCSCAP